MNMEKSIVISDLHIPFEDKKAVKLVLKFIKDFQPDNIFLNGDIMDCYSLSTFIKHQDISFNNELRQVREFFTSLRLVSPKSKAVWIQGNHEYRFSKHLIERSRNLFSVEDISLEKLTKLDEFGIEYVKNSNADTFYKYGNLLIGHFDRVSKGSCATAKSLVADKGTSLIQGHVHRVGTYVKRLGNGEFLCGYEGGCLCKLEQEYATLSDWSHGFITLIKTNKQVNVTLVPILNYEFTYGDKVYN